MSIFDDCRLFVARDLEDGKVEVFTPDQPEGINIDGVVHGAMFWGSQQAFDLPDYVGEVPENMTFPPVTGGTRFAIFEWAANSAGKFDANEDIEGDHGTEEGAADMHATDSVDFEYIISGKVDIEFPGGQTITLRAGDMMVMGGAAHAWKNHYDEPCRYLAVLNGAPRRK